MKRSPNTAIYIYHHGEYLPRDDFLKLSTLNKRPIMKHSIFITPSFMTIELGFLVCTAAAAYELFIGDFIWSREEEERRDAEQNARGRGMTQRTLHSTQRHYHRSLSPGRGGRGRSLGQVSKEEETTSLLQGRRYPKRLIESNASEEESFPSPGDLRSLDAGRGTRGGSAGDSTRRLVSHHQVGAFVDQTQQANLAGFYHRTFYYSCLHRILLICVSLSLSVL